MTRDRQPTREIARDRLKAVLEIDRGYLTGKALALLKHDLAGVVHSYIEAEEAKLDVQFERQEIGRSIMTIRVPVGKPRNRPTLVGEEE